MPKSTPINPPIITWLSKCFARNILERPTKQEVIIKITYWSVFNDHYDECGKDKII